MSWINRTTPSLSLSSALTHHEVFFIAMFVPGDLAALPKLEEEPNLEFSAGLVRNAILGRMPHDKTHPPNPTKTPSNKNKFCFGHEKVP